MVNEPLDRDGRELEATLSRAKTGSASALARALNACRPELLRAARRDVHRGKLSTAAGSDLVQSAFLKAMRGFGGFEGTNLGELRAWLRRILRNEFVRAINKDSLQRRAIAEMTHADGGPHEGSASSAVLRNERRELIRQALARLSDVDRRILRARFDRGLTFAELGVELGISDDAARKRFHRALHRLERELPRSLRHRG